jgi:hypothetical protein
MRTPRRSGNEPGDDCWDIEDTEGKFETLRHIEINSAISRQRAVDRHARD